MLGFRVMVGVGLGVTIRVRGSIRARVNLFVPHELSSLALKKW